MEDDDDEHMDGNVIERATFAASMSAQLVSPRQIEPRFLVRSLWDVEHVRRRARGALYDWVQLSRDLSKNTCTHEGLNKLLDVMFKGGTPITAWYIGLFENDYSPLLTDTYAAPGCTESTAYVEATRPVFQGAAVTNQVVTNTANRALYTCNATKTMYGGILVGGGTAPSTKGNTAGGGLMYASCRFVSSKGVEMGDQIKVTVALTAADIG